MKNDFYIAAKMVQLLDESRKPIGIMSPGRAKSIANDKDIELVCIDATKFPPVYALGREAVVAIESDTVRLMDENHQSIGVISTSEAKKMATERGLDLIAIAANQNPPVFMLGDKGKYEYEQKKRAKEQEKKNRATAKASAEKELVLPADTSDSSKGDRSRIMNQGNAFLAEGHPVKFRVQFNGRKISHSEDVMDRLVEEMREVVTNGTIGKIDRNDKRFFINCTPKKK